MQLNRDRVTEIQNTRQIFHVLISAIKGDQWNCAALFLEYFRVFSEAVGSLLYINTAVIK